MTEVPTIDEKPRIKKIRATVTGVEQTSRLLYPPIPGPTGLVLRLPPGVTRDDIKRGDIIKKATD